MATITVRQATPGDAPELARMLDLFDGMGATPEQVAARMLACQHVLTTYLGEADGRPVGFACLRLVPHLQGDEPYAELTDIHVDAPFRRRGVARALTSLAVLVYRAGELSRTYELLDEAQALYSSLGAGYDRSRVVFARGLVALYTGDYAASRDQFEIALSLAREIGAPAGTMVALHNLGESEFRLGEPERAEAHLRESLRLSEELDDRIVEQHAWLVRRGLDVQVIATEQRNAISP